MDETRARMDVLEPQGKSLPVTCGLVAVLAADPELALSAERAIRADSRCEAGERGGRWLPLAVETSEPMTVQRWLEALPGVERCEVVFIGSENGLGPSGSSKHHPTTESHE